ncbi:hemoglobin subunit alpha-A-like [Tiliqua scincoides]|uniref:hemoglobin subunit alpha-A-like n=1 Tax=Tiliqua scincoides TaxID=71010 RepID=UPI003461A023
MLTATDKTNVKAIWAPVVNNAELFGAEFLERLFCVFPSTKTYFPDYDLSHNSPDIKAQGKKIAEALTRAVGNLDDVAGTLSALSDLHAEKLRVDPVNFGKLRECIEVTLAAHHGGLIKADVLCSLDKFLCAVARVLAARYR